MAEDVVPTSWFDQAHAVGAGTSGPVGAVGAVDLSARDLDVLRQLADGRTTADIAHALAYSDSTVKQLVHAILQRLGARNRAHAVALAIRADLI